MRPGWARGTLFVLTQESASNARVGQEIVYLPPQNLFVGLIVHRVIAIKKLRAGEYVAQTKGLANPVQDSWKDHLSGMIWKVDAPLPWLGMIPIEIGHL
jgi:hypothetical protein